MNSPFFNDSQVYYPRNVNTSLAGQEDLLPFRASIPDQQAEPCSSSVLTPVAEQRQCYNTARADVSKQLAEQKENHVQRFQSNSCQVSIPSQAFRQSRRVKKKPAYLGDSLTKHLMKSHGFNRLTA